jgi:tetrahydromethanopterin S-methyltransferase subunit A
MEDDYYPWGGEFTVCTATSSVAVVLLNIDYTPPDIVAVYGPLKTENIGVEKIVANVISNPHIRYLVICGEDIRGHRSGGSLIALNKNGVDTTHRIIEAPGAIPYIENIDADAIQRFQQQIEIIDLVGVTDAAVIDTKIQTCVKSKPPCFGQPYIAIRIKPEAQVQLDDQRALHARIIINYMGKVEKRGE